MDKLKHLREESGRSQNSMAKHIGVSLSLYEKIERGTLQPSRSFMQKVKVKFPDISVDDIFYHKTA